ncbi:MAG: DUF4282 domain-containing protein, partial [Limnobacter sp.]|nr:DUF4282 domain-containing protein [Limnobacter sp.]
PKSNENANTNKHHKANGESDVADPLQLKSRFDRFKNAILDFQFHENLTIALLPAFYIILLVGATAVAIIINIGAWQISTLVGVTVSMLSPFALMLVFAVIRAALEFIVMGYRIMLTLERMDRIPSQVDNLNSKVDGISDLVHGFERRIEHIEGRVDEVADNISFLKHVSGMTNLPGRLLGRKK